MRLWLRYGCVIERPRPVKTIGQRLAGIACGLVLAASAAAELREHPLISVLNAYESAGYSFVYSKDLVRQDL